MVKTLWAVYEFDSEGLSKPLLFFTWLNALAKAEQLAKASNLYDEQFDKDGNGSFFCRTDPLREHGFANYVSIEKIQIEDHPSLINYEIPC